MQLTSLSLALTRAGFLSFSPASLFAASEPGVWYDPSDFSTMFQDSSGTTPVTAVEQPVGLMLDKSKGLTLGPELVPSTISSVTGAGWTTNGTSITATNSTASGTIALTTSTSSAKFYRVTFTASALTGATSYMVFSGGIAAITKRINTAKFYSFTVPGQGTTAFEIAPYEGTAFSVTISNISVRELPGNHAFQTVSASRPVLSARVNLLTKTEQFDDAAWTRGSPARVTITANATTAPDGTSTADLMTETVENSTHRVLFDNVASSSVLVNNTLSCSFKPNTGNPFALLAITDSTGNNQVRAWFNLATGAVGTIQNIGAGSAASATIAADDQGFYRCAVSGLVGGAGTCYVFVGMANADASLSYAGNTGRSVYIWGADLRVTNTGTNLPVYQRVNTSTDYDTTGFPLYLRFDGVDDFLVTNTITPGTDKAQVFAGVRKLSDAAIGVIAELSANANNNNGSFWLIGPALSSGGPQYGMVTRGNIAASAAGYMPTTYSAPITNTITTLFNLAGTTKAEVVIPRITGVVDQGEPDGNTLNNGGTFLSYPLYIGRRGGTTLPFNGHIYSLIVRFGANLPAATIANTEAWVNGKTKAY